MNMYFILKELPDPLQKLKLLNFSFFLIKYSLMTTNRCSLRMDQLKLQKVRKHAFT